MKIMTLDEAHDLQKGFDMDLDQGVAGIGAYGADECAPGDLSWTNIPPNAKCLGCYHYNQNSGQQGGICSVKTLPDRCGNGSEPEQGYAPVITDRQAYNDWKAKQGHYINTGGAVAVPDASQPVPFKVEILGDSALTLSNRNAFRKSSAALNFQKHESGNHTAETSHGMYRIKPSGAKHALVYRPKGSDKKVPLGSFSHYSSATSHASAHHAAKMVKGMSPVRGPMPKPAKLHVETHPHGTYHVADLGAGVHGAYFTPKRGSKAKLIGQSLSMDSAQKHISAHAAQMGSIGMSGKVSTSFKSLNISNPESRIAKAMRGHRAYTRTTKTGKLVQVGEKAGAMGALARLRSQSATQAPAAAEHPKKAKAGSVKFEQFQQGTKKAVVSHGTYYIQHSAKTKAGERGTLMYKRNGASNKGSPIHSGRLPLDKLYALAEKHNAKITADAHGATGGRALANAARAHAGPHEKKRLAERAARRSEYNAIKSEDYPDMAKAFEDESSEESEYNDLEKSRKGATHLPGKTGKTLCGKAEPTFKSLNISNPESRIAKAMRGHKAYTRTTKTGKLVQVGEKTGAQGALARLQARAAPKAPVAAEPKKAKAGHVKFEQFQQGLKRATVAHGTYYIRHAAKTKAGERGTLMYKRNGGKNAGSPIHSGRLPLDKLYALAEKHNAKITSDAHGATSGRALAHAERAHAGPQEKKRLAARAARHAEYRAMKSEEPGEEMEKSLKGHLHLPGKAGKTLCGKPTHEFGARVHKTSGDVTATSCPGCRSALTKKHDMKKSETTHPLSVDGEQDLSDIVSMVDFLEKSLDRKKHAKLIGHTSSGKEVMAAGKYHGAFDAKDHDDAAELHQDIGEKLHSAASKWNGQGGMALPPASRQYMKDAADHHGRMARGHSQEAMKERQKKDRDPESISRYSNDVDESFKSLGHTSNKTGAGMVGGVPSSANDFALAHYNRLDY